MIIYTIALFLIFRFWFSTSSALLQNEYVFLSDKGLLAECMDVIGNMYKVKFDPKDYCVKPIITENNLNGHLIKGY